jgi:hypothetical protein
VRAARLSGAGTPFQVYQAIGYDRQPYASFSAGLNQLQAAAAGCMMGVFGWANPNTGLVSNSYAAGLQLGFVLPTFNGWNWQRLYRLPPNANLLDAATLARITGYPNPTVPALPVASTVLRSGMPLVLAISGDFYTPFPNGAVAAARVWADPVFGVAYCADGGGYIETPWVSMQNGPAGCSARISSFATLGD